jgi:hypothetical protein
LGCGEIATNCWKKVLTLVAREDSQQTVSQ